jgi:serine/threonine-protein kinase RIO1
MFMSREQPQRRTLADIIMEKLRAVEAARDSEDVDRAVERMLDPKVVEVYRGCISTGSFKSWLPWAWRRGSDCYRN